MSDVATETTDAGEAEFYCPACGARYSTPGVCNLGHAATTVVPLGEEAEAEAGQDPAGGGGDSSSSSDAAAADAAPADAAPADAAPAAEPAAPAAEPAADTAQTDSPQPAADPAAGTDAQPAADSADTPPAPSPIETAQQNLAAVKAQIDSALGVIGDELAKLAG